MCNARFMEALCSYWNPWKCKTELSGLFLLDDMSRNVWTIWTWDRSLPSAQASHNESPLLHSAQKTFSKSWLQPWCQLAGKLQKCTDSFFLFAFLSAGSADTQDVLLHHWVYHRAASATLGITRRKEGKERCDWVPESRICPSFHGKWQDIHFSTSYTHIVTKCIHKCACWL